MSDQLPAKRPKSPDGLAELSAAREIPAIVADAGKAPALRGKNSSLAAFGAPTPDELTTVP